MPKHRTAFIALFAAYVLWGLYAIFFGERIPVNGGLGWDGKIYYFISLDFFEYVRGRVFNSYYVHRVVPSLIVKAMHWLTGTEHSYELTGTYFGLLNLVSMTVGALLLVSSLGGVAWKWRWMAAFMALVSFGGVRQAFYYPILTDWFAFLLGSALLWAYLRERSFLLYILTAIGAFTFPSLLWMALPLMVFQREEHPVQTLRGSPWTYPLIFGLSVLTLALIGPAFNGKMDFGTFQPTRTMALVALPWTLLYVAYLWYGVDAYARVRSSLSNLRIMGLARWLSVFVAVLVTGWWAKPAPFGITDFALNIIGSGLVHPLASPVAHIVYLGPLWLLILLHPVRVKNTMTALPQPLFWCTAFTMMLAVGSESRTTVVGLPFITYCLVMALKDKELNRVRILSIVAVALVLSKFWWTMNVESGQGHFMDLHMERMLMHIGPWMTLQGYWLNLVTVSLCGLWLLVVFREPRSKV